MENTKRDSLKTIQVLARIGHVLSKIAFICCIVGASICIIGIASLAVGNDGVFKLGGVTIHGPIEQGFPVDAGSMYAVMATGLVFCICEGTVAKFAEVYFKHELASGTPFTFAGASELMRLGILAIALPLGASTLSAIVRSILDNSLGGISSISLSIDSSVAFGVMFIVMSVIIRYGAELVAPKASE